MTVFRDPRAPAGRVVFGGVEFIDGVTADINPGEGTVALFTGAGIVAETLDVSALTAETITLAAEAPAAEDLEPETPKPAPRRKK